MYPCEKLEQMNRHDRREALRGDKKKNNRATTNSRCIHLAPVYSQKEIDEAPTSVERARRARCYKNIQENR